MVEYTCIQGPTTCIGGVLKSPGASGLWILMSCLNSNNPDFMGFDSPCPQHSEYKISVLCATFQEFLWALGGISGAH